MNALFTLGLLLNFIFLFLTFMRWRIIAANINGMNSMVNGGMPRKEIHLPPNILRIGLFKRSAIRYIPGTISKVIKKAKARPKIMVQESGFQNTTLSPPKKI